MPYYGYSAVKELSSSMANPLKTDGLTDPRGQHRRSGGIIRHCLPLLSHGPQPFGAGTIPRLPTWGAYSTRPMREEIHIRS